MPVTQVYTKPQGALAKLIDALCPGELRDAAEAAMDSAGELGDGVMTKIGEKVRKRWPLCRPASTRSASTCGAFLPPPTH